MTSMTDVPVPPELAPTPRPAVAGGGCYRPRRPSRPTRTRRGVARRPLPGRLIGRASVSGVLVSGRVAGVAA